MKNIGIVCEGPTDYVILKSVIDTITRETNHYFLLQPDPDAIKRYVNGWKGVLKWCIDHAAIKKQFMHDVQPALDLLVIQMDGDVSRKEKPAHCHCEPTICPDRDTLDPLYCDTTKCPVSLPCGRHGTPVTSYVEHLKGLIASKLIDTDDTCIVIPCDSLEAWVVAAYDGLENVETIENPWENIISARRPYHNIRIPRGQKKTRIFEEFAPVVSQNWQQVTHLCQSARDFEKSILTLV